MKKEMVCIACPIGCALIATREGSDGVIAVSGNRCKRGEEYAREELLSPRRTVTATVALKGSIEQRLPVKTDKPLPKELIRQILTELYRAEVSAPVDCGDIIIDDFADSGVAVVATKSCYAFEKAAE